MLLGNAWGLLALLALPAIVGIHLLRRRHRPLATSALFLWRSAVRSGDGGRQRQPLQNRLSLWCEILAALAVAWYLADPHTADAGRAVHRVLVLDARWSAQAKLAGGGTAWEAARAEWLSRLADWRDTVRVTVVASGLAPRLAAGPETSPAEAALALNRFLPDQPFHDLAPALALAVQVGGPEAEITVLSDRLPKDLPPGMGAWAVGEARPTSGIAEARWLDDGRPRITARLVSCGAPARRTLTLTDAAGRVLGREVVTLTPDAPRLLVWPLPQGVAGTLRLALDGDDPLPLDDVVDLLPPPSRTVGVAVALSDESAAAAARQALAGVPDVRLDAATIHLDLTDAAGDPPAGRWRLALVSGDGAPAVGPFLLRRSHPLLLGVDTTALLWTGSAPWRTLTVNDPQPLATAGERVLADERLHGRDRVWTLHVDWARSSLARHPAWPVLVANACAARRDALPGPRAVNLLPGQPSAAVLPPGAGSARLSGPGGASAQLLPDNDGVIDLPPLAPGRWRLETLGIGWDLAVHRLDARLADLSEAGRGAVEAKTGGTAAVARRRSPAEHLLPLLVLLAAAGAAWAAHRREGSQS